MISVGSRIPLFHTVITSVPIRQACQSDVGIILSTGVNQWLDLSGAGFHYTQGTAASQPSYGTSKLNGYPVLTFDGTDDFLTSSLALPAVGTSPTYACFVGRTITWVSGGTFLGDSQTTASSFPRYVNMSPTTPSIQMWNGTSQNTTAMGIGVWNFVEVYWNNATTDFLRVGATTVTGTNTLNQYTALGRQIGDGGTTNNGNVEMSMLIYTAGLPTVAERTYLRTLILAKYGNTVAT